MKKNWLIPLMTVILLLSLGARGRYSSVWKRRSGVLTYSRGNVTISNGFTTLGDAAPAIKMKKLTGTAPAVGANGTIAHGLNRSKIIGVQVSILNDSDNCIPPGFTSVANHEFDFFVEANDVRIYCISANSSSINGNAVHVLIIYEE